MKIDVHDPRYKPEHDQGNVYLDGALLPDVVAFDDVEGWVETLVRDEGGKIQHDGEKLFRKRLTGTVVYVPLAK